jgi:hypothetical protein
MRVFLEAYAQIGGVTEAAAIAGINRRTHYRKLNDPTYRAIFQETEEQAAQALEDEAVRRAKDGVRRPVMYQGAPVKIGRRTLYHVEYSDQLLMVLLKRFRPQLYREYITPEHTARVDIAERLLAARRRLIEMRAKDAIELAAG